MNKKNEILEIISSEQKTTQRSRSKISIFRELFNDIEEALELYDYNVVSKSLEKKGLVVSSSVFGNMLQRVRKERINSHRVINDKSFNEVNQIVGIGTDDRILNNNFDSINNTDDMTDRKKAIKEIQDTYLPENGISQTALNFLNKANK